MTSAQLIKSKGGKYTQGFSFHHDPVMDEGIRKLVERSGAAVNTLMQEVFVRTEKQLLGMISAEAIKSPEALARQMRSVRALSEVVKARRFLEKGVSSAMTCAFAELAHDAHGLADNVSCMEKERSFFERHQCESLNLYDLLQVGEKVSYSTNSLRPLLVHLNAQLLGLMDLKLQHLSLCPLSPAVFITGFLLGLQCTHADVATKKVLLDNFEQFFLARLSILLNNITLRLEEEGVQAHKAVGFEEVYGGCFSYIFQADRLCSFEALQNKVKEIALFDGVSSAEEYVAPLSDIYYTLAKEKQNIYRQQLHLQERLVLCDARKEVCEFLNSHFLQKKLPAFLYIFLSTQWPDILFDTLLLHGKISDYWQELYEMQELLIGSIQAELDEEQRKKLSQAAPALAGRFRTLLEDSGYRYTDTVSFFEQLKNLHLQVLQKKLDPSHWREWQPLLAQQNLPPLEEFVSPQQVASVKNIEAVLF